MPETATRTDLPELVHAWLTSTQRSEAGWARELGISRQMLHKVLNGETVPSLALAVRMSETSGIRIELFALIAPRRRAKDVA